MVQRIKRLSTILFFITTYAYSQPKTIAGYISDATTGERLIFAAVYDSISRKGTVTNEYGYYSLPLENEKVYLIASFIGYTPYKQALTLNKDAKLNIRLQPGYTINEVEVTTQQTGKADYGGFHKLQMKQLAKLPVIAGEPDLMKLLQLLPGVQPSSEGNTGLYVRGGSADQNLILLDGVPVYNPNHLFGFFSIFNPDAINDLHVYKGNFPARLGGRLSSVIDIYTKKGNTEKLSGSASIGLIASNISLEGPIKNSNTSFIVSARRSYIDLVAQQLLEIFTDYNTANYYFYDVNAKVNHAFSDRSHVYFSFYKGKDYGTTENEGVGYGTRILTTDITNWGNMLATMRWNYVFNNKLFCNTTLNYSKFDYSLENKNAQTSGTFNDDYSSTFSSRIEDFIFKADFNYQPLYNHQIRFGINQTLHNFKPGVQVFRKTNMEDQLEADTTLGNKNIQCVESVLYAEDEIQINTKISVNIGLRASMFNTSNKTYADIEPRLSAQYKLTNKIALTTSAVKSVQYIHLLSNSKLSLATDLWIPSTEKIKPEKAYQISLGVNYQLTKMWSFTTEAYYRTMQDLIEYKEGASFMTNASSWDEKVETGAGLAYGVEFMIEKQSGKLNGSLNYTLARSERTFSNINFGETFPFRYDKRHYVNIALNYRLTKSIDAGIVWLYSTGNAVTYSDWKDGGYLIYRRNSYRLSPYHRLDVSLAWHKVKKLRKTTISIGAYNVYNRNNIYNIELHHTLNDARFFVTIEKSLFPVIPFINYRIEF